MAFAVRTAARPTVALPARRAAARRVAVRAEPTDAAPAEPAAPVEAAAPVAAPAPVQPPTPAAPVVAPAPSFTDAMAFSGPAPELINSRLAMLAFVSALGAELATGEPVLQQLRESPVLVAAAAVLFAWASLVPILLGKAGDYDKGVGPFTRTAEIFNGRAAMIGFAALLAVEATKHTALF